MIAAPELTAEDVLSALRLQGAVPRITDEGKFRVDCKAGIPPRLADAVRTHKAGLIALLNGETLDEANGRMARIEEVTRLTEQVTTLQARLSKGQQVLDEYEFDGKPKGKRYEQALSLWIGLLCAYECACDDLEKAMKELPERAAA